MNPCALASSTPPIAQLQDLKVRGPESRSQCMGVFSRPSDPREGAEQGAEQRLKRLGDTLATQRQRIQRERNIKVGRIIPGTAQVKMRGHCDSFRLYDIQVALDRTKTDATTDTVGLTFGRLRHICTGTDRLELIQAHTKSPTLDHWMDSIFQNLPTAPWVLQTNDERSANYLTTFQKSQLTQEWVAEKVVLTQGASPWIITAYPILDARKMRMDLKRYPIVNYSGLEQLPTPILTGVKKPQPQELAAKADRTMPKVTQASKESATSGSALIDSNPRIQSFETEARIILEWTQAENQMQMQVELIESQLELMLSTATRVVRSVLTTEEFNGLPELTVPAAIQVFSGLINLKYFDKVDALNVELFLFDQAKTQLHKTFCEKSKKAFLHREFPDLSIKKRLQGWDDRIAVGLEKFYRQNITLTVSRKNLFVSAKPLLADILKLQRQKLEFVKADTYVVVDKGVKLCNANARHLYDNNLEIASKGQELKQLLDAKSVVFPADLPYGKNGLMSLVDTLLGMFEYICARESVLDRIPGAKAAIATASEKLGNIDTAYFEAKIALEVAHRFLSGMAITNDEIEKVTHSRFKQSISKLR